MFSKRLTAKNNKGLEKWFIKMLKWSRLYCADPNRRGTGSNNIGELEKVPESN